MAMLAEPRQRKRYNLVPRGKALYEDDNRFGTKMLEKMGWSKGKGLGANEDGSKDFVRVRYKNDANGFGYEERDDQWTQHESSFNGLLKSLHGGEESGIDANNAPDKNDDLAMPTVGFGFQSEPAKGKDKLKEKISGESLEEKSKKSKARVHYKKFTRGKDLARYSEKDLANIFGKKPEEENVNGIYEQFSAIQAQLEESKSNENQEEEEEEKEVKSNLAGVPTINTGLSVTEYFKQKMEAMKRKMQKPETKEPETIQLINVEACADNGEIKKKKKNKRVAAEHLDPEETLVEALKKKKKKSDTDLVKDDEVADQPKKKTKKKSNDMETTEEIANKDLEIMAAEVVKTKKSKKKEKHLVEAVVNTQMKEEDNKVEPTLLDVKEKHKEKKKTKASKICQQTAKAIEPEILKTKKVKNRKSSTIEEVTLIDTQINTERRSAKLSTKKRKTPEDDAIDAPSSTVNSHKPTHKKKKDRNSVTQI